MLMDEVESHRKIWEFTEKSGNLQKNLGIYRKIWESYRITQKSREFYRKNFRKAKKNLKIFFKIIKNILFESSLSILYRDNKKI